MTTERKTYLVTGASSGIGRATACQLSEAEADVILVARSTEQLEKTIHLMRPGNHTIVACDLAQTEEIAATLSPTIGQYSGIDGFVHGAGITALYPLARNITKRMDAIMRVNFYSFVEILRLLVKAKNTDQSLLAVGLSSIASRSGMAAQTAYAASKAAMDAAVRCLAVELAPKHVRINSICPAYVDTEMLDDIKALVPGFVENIPSNGQFLGLVDPHDVAQMILFLLSDAAKSITGMNLPVTGGAPF